MQELNLGCGNGCSVFSKEGQKLQHVTLGKGKGEEESVRHLLPLLPHRVSQKCYLLPGTLVIFPVPHLCSPEPVLQSILEAGKSVVLPSKVVLSGVEQPSVAVPVHPSSCLRRAICCPLLLLLANYCLSLRLRVRRVVQCGTCGKSRILCRILRI